MEIPVKQQGIMALKVIQSGRQTQSQGQKQQLSITFSIRTATKLNMTQSEYIDHITKMVHNNPAAEIVEDDGLDNVENVDQITEDRELATIENTANDYYQQVFDALDNQTLIGKPTRSSVGLENVDSSSLLQSQPDVEQSFTDYLLDQITTDNATLRTAIKFLIFSLDESGFLTESLDTLSYDFVKQLFENYAKETDLQKVYDMEDHALELLREAHRILLTFEPKGVGTSSVPECLLYQLRQRPQDEVTALASSIVANHYDRFVRLGGKYDSQEGVRFAKEMVKRYDADPRDFVEALQEIRMCKPMPSTGFSNNVVVQQPDFFVKVLEDNRIMIVQNFGFIPRFRRAKDSSDLLKKSRGEKDGEFHESFQKDLQEVDAEIQDFRMRNTSLMHVMIGLVKMQNRFFITGDKKEIVPCTRHSLSKYINETSNAPGKIISYYSVARAIKDRCFAMEGGIYPLSMFFGATIQSAQGTKSKSYVRERILEMMSSTEGKLLSDQQMTDILNQEGLKIARRTVAKYRSEMKIVKNYHSEKRVKKVKSKRKKNDKTS